MFLNKWAINAIKKYQSNKSKPKRCRHFPTCSNYGLECYKKFNFVKASFLTGYRIIRCNPLSKKYFDPVPLSNQEKREKEVYDIKASLIDCDLIQLYNKTNSIDSLIIYIWENSDLHKDILLFYAKLDRIIYLTKIKKINKPYKDVLNYVNNYMMSDIFIHPSIYINKQGLVD